MPPIVAPTRHASCSRQPVSRQTRHQKNSSYYFSGGGLARWGRSSGKMPGRPDFDKLTFNPGQL
jgi:hypothetical protein